MRQRLIAVVAAGLMVLAAVSGIMAQQTIEGIVVSAKLTACDPRPGGCEGSLVLEPKSGTSGPVTMKVVRGTQITEGDKPLVLPGTNRRFVAITYVEDKGEKIARSIQVRDAR